MSSATGNPVFLTFGGDGSKATVTYTPAATQSIPNPASVTLTLAGLGLSASNALSQSAEALEAASAAGEAVKSAVAGCVQTSQANKANGYVGLDATENASIPGYLTIGASGATSPLVLGKSGSANWQRIDVYSGTGAGGSPDTSFIFHDGTGNSDGGVWLGVAAFQPGSDNTADLGGASNRWANLYLGSSPQVTSDASEKTVVGTLGDASFEEGAKLETLFDALSARVYLLADGSRHHIGLIAQDVQVALTDAGLDPAQYAMWGQDVMTQLVSTTGADGKVSHSVETVKNGDGSTAYRQSLRYDELCVLIFAAAKAKLSSQAARLTALETAVAALQKSGS